MRKEREYKERKTLIMPSVDGSHYCKLRVFQSPKSKRQIRIPYTGPLSLLRTRILTSGHEKLQRRLRNRRWKTRAKTKADEILSMREITSEEVEKEEAGPN